MAWLLACWLLLAPYVQGPKPPLSLTPIRPESLTRQAVRLECGEQTLALQDAPYPCIKVHVRRQRELIQRLQRRIEQEQRRRR